MTYLYPINGTSLAKAEYLVKHKGEMSVELWNDRAQCVLAPLAAQVETLAKALRYYVKYCDHHPCDCLMAREALKAAGVEGCGDEQG